MNKTIEQLMNASAGDMEAAARAMENNAMQFRVMAEMSPAEDLRDSHIACANDCEVQAEELRLAARKKQGLVIVYCSISYYQHAAYKAMMTVPESKLDFWIRSFFAGDVCGSSFTIKPETHLLVLKATAGRPADRITFTAKLSHRPTSPLGWQSSGIRLANSSDFERVTYCAAGQLLEIPIAAHLAGPTVISKIQSEAGALELAGMKGGR